MNYYIVRIPNKRRSRYRVYFVERNELAWHFLIIKGGGDVPIVHEYETAKCYTDAYKELYEKSTTRVNISHKKYENIQTLVDIVIASHG